MGFRPFLYRLAKQHSLSGWVSNQSNGVFLHIEGNNGTARAFIDVIKPEAPAEAYINEIHLESSPHPGLLNFFIDQSQELKHEITGISPDIAVCCNCMDDLLNQHHRINYPLINCTNCGPRFSIIKDLPYDRNKTTMAEFEMCPECNKEYTNSTNRRFHAQPVACNKCVQLLRENNFEVFLNKSVPSNDGGISLGQLVIAAKRRTENVS